MNSTVKNLLIVAAVGVGGYLAYTKIWPLIRGAGGGGGGSDSGGGGDSGGGAVDTGGNPLRAGAIAYKKKMPITPAKKHIILNMPSTTSSFGTSQPGQQIIIRHNA